MQGPEEPPPLTQIPEPQQTPPQEDDRYCCICVQNERMHQTPCPGTQSAFPVPCGHKVHFLCFFVESSTEGQMIGQCPICNVPFFPMEQVEWVVNYLDNHERRLYAEEDEEPPPVGPQQTPRKTIQEVWNEEPQFRKEVRALRDIGVKFTKAKKELLKEARTLQNQFTDEIKHVKEYLKDVKGKYKKLFGQIKAKRSALAYKSLYSRRQNDILRKYGLDHYSSLKKINEIRGAPRIKTRRQLYVNYRLRNSHYLFRVRV